MSDLFSSRFTGLYEDTFPCLVFGTPSRPPFPGFGLDGGWAGTCVRNVISVIRIVPAASCTVLESIPQPSTKTAVGIRLQYALYSTFVPATIDGSDTFVTLVEFQDALHLVGDDACTFGGCASMFSGDFRVNSNGSVTLSVGFPVSLYTSGAAAFPIDGTMHGIQILLSFNGATSVDYDVLIDNVSVLSGNAPCPVIGGLWGTGINFGVGCIAPVSFFPTVFFHRGGVNVVSLTINKQNADPFSWMESYGEVVIVDNANAIDYPAGDALPITNPSMCISAPIAVTALALDCPTSHITITGTNFSVNPTVVVRDPNDQVIGSTILSHTPTVIVVSLDSFTVPGTWCVSVT